MGNKIIYTIGIIALLAGIFTMFANVVNAESFNFLYTSKQNLIITLRNDADIEKSKNKISEIPQIKIINTKSRDEEWSKMVNKYDLPNMENPYKNEFVIKVNKKADINAVYNEIKELSFVENVEYALNNLIDKYQEQYFIIIKRNNVLLNFEDNKTLNNDRKELNKLFAKVKKQVRNKTYLKEYKRIEKKYSKCDEMTTIGINDFSEKNYKEIDNLLNKVYKEIQTKIPADDLKKLATSEQKWLKELNNYEKVFNSMDFGTIGTSIHYDYQINMKSFRTLLLMLYL